MRSSKVIIPLQVVPLSILLHLTPKPLTSSSYITLNFTPTPLRPTSASASSIHLPPFIPRAQYCSPTRATYALTAMTQPPTYTTHNHAPLLKTLSLTLQSPTTHTIKPSSTAHSSTNSLMPTLPCLLWSFPNPTQSPLTKLRLY